MGATGLIRVRVAPNATDRPGSPRRKGVRQTTRTFSYTNQGDLSSSLDVVNATTTTYGYDSAGTHPTQMMASATQTHNGITTTLPRAQYVFDDFGRVNSRTENGAGSTFTYGANNQIVQAQSGGNTLSDVYDESGQRLLKRKNGMLATVYTDAGIIDVEGDHLTSDIRAQGLTQILDVAGVHIGTLTKGKLVSVSSDIRGTVSSPMSTPYGD